MDIFELDRQFISPTYARYPIAVKSGKGSLVADCNGKKYIDLGTGIAVNALGIRNPAWTRAVKKQLGLLSHCSNLYYSEPQALLAQALCERTGMKKVFFGNSGAEANEAAIKAARKYSFDKYGEGRDVIVTLKNSFHGRTVTTLSATGQDVFHNYFFPFTGGFVYAEANNLADTLEKLDTGVCAVMAELVQGEGGVNVLQKDYVNRVAEYCKAHDILFIIDEVQTGNGRTGKLFCWENYGFAPDIATTAKGLGGGLPIGAAMFGEKCAETLSKGSHGSTFGGNPICAAGALAILNQLDGDMLAGVREREKLIREALSGQPGIEFVCGMGLLLGVKTVKAPAEVAARCMENGVLVLTAKDKVRLLPALNIPIPLLKKALGVIKSAVI